MKFTAVLLLTLLTTESCSGSIFGMDQVIVASGQVQGTVLLPDGSPADRVAVGVRCGLDANGFGRGSHTDSNGHYRVRIDITPDVAGLYLGSGDSIPCRVTAHNRWYAGSSDLIQIPFSRTSFTSPVTINLQLDREIAR